MFKIGSFEDELRSSMEKNLVTNQVEKQYGLNKLAQAADLLNNAATIFEQAGMQEEASEITEILLGLAANLS
jgi:hypothetical protein